VWSVKVIFMVGNKSDLDAQRDVTFDEAKQFAEENGTQYSYLLLLFKTSYVQTITYLFVCSFFYGFTEESHIGKATCYCRKAWHCIADLSLFLNVPVATEMTVWERLLDTYLRQKACLEKLRTYSTFSSVKK